MIVTFEIIGKWLSKFFMDRNAHWLDNKNCDIPSDAFLILPLVFVCHMRYDKINCEEIEQRSYDVHIDNIVYLYF